MSSPETVALPSRHAKTSGDSGERRSIPGEIPAHHAATSHPQTGKERTAPISPSPSSSHHGVATQNEGLKGVKEDPTNLANWDAFHHHLLKLRDAFGNWNNRQILKDITASPQVLKTYHDSFLFGDVPLSVKARTTLRTGLIGSIWNLVEFVLALLSGVLYVYSAYRPEVHDNWAYRIQNAISFAFIADYILRVYCEPVRLYYIFSFWGVVHLLSTMPVILVFRVFNVTNKAGVFGSSVTQQITLLTIATFVIIFLDAGILHWVEYHLAPPSKRAACSDQGCITFWEALYFLIVTVATVGYGDVTPDTIIGQLVAIITIIAALTILPIQIGRITALAYQRPYGGSFSSSKILGSRFLIISGSITFSAVQSFLAEFYNPTHCGGGSRMHYIGVIEKRCVDLIFDLPDLEVYPLRVIILAPFSPSFELKQILHLYNGLVEFIEGSPVRQADLERVSANKAAAFFLLADNEAENVQVEDAAQVVRALAVRRFCLHSHHYKRRLRIIVEVLDPNTHSSAVWDKSVTGDIEVVCPVKVHYKMMARSCAVHGLYTLMTNLFTSELQLKYMNRKHFLTEYFHSFDNEVYPVILPETFHGVAFEEVADFIFLNFRSILFAVDTSVGYKSNEQPDRKVLLFPKGRPINSDDVGILISSDLHTAYAISRYRPKEDAIGLLHNLWVRATTTPTIKRYNQGTELLDPTSGKWKRTSSTVSRAFRRGTSFVSRSTAFGEEGPGSYSSHPTDGNRKLEFQLRSAIQNVYSEQDYPDWGKNETATAELGILQGRDVESSELESRTVENIKVGTGEPATASQHRFPKGMSLTKAAEDLLAWPPLSYNDRPHPAVIEEKEAVILKDLKERTLTMVAFNVPHILVCCQSGWPSHFFYFLVEIRKPGFANPPVVMLHPKEVTAKQWGSVGAFKDVFFLKGSPLYELDLLRGGVLQAEKIVVLADQGTPVDLRGEKGDDKKYLKRTPAAYTSDVENIVVAANIQRLYGHSPIDNVIVEMQHTEGFFYLRPQYEISRAHYPSEGLKRNRDALVHFGPPFMEGKAVCASLLGFLMRSSFYNRNTQTIVDQMIQGGYTKTDGGLSTDRQKILDQVTLPEEYANRPYSELFLGLLREKGVLAIGLYRVRGTLGAPTAYVLTNPLPDCIVNPDDLVYVLY